MKRAFWFDESYTDQQMVDAMRTQKIHAVHFMKKYKNRSVTENGAMGYRTTGLASIHHLRRPENTQEYFVDIFKCLLRYIVRHYPSFGHTVMW